MLKFIIDLIVTYTIIYLVAIWIFLNLCLWHNATGNPSLKTLEKIGKFITWWTIFKR